MQETLTNKRVKTRKPHKCYRCLETFPIRTEMRLKESLNDFEGKIVIFTWVDDTNPKITRTAMASQFKTGAIEPVERQI